MKWNFKLCVLLLTICVCAFSSPKPLSLWIMPNGASSKEMLEEKLQEFTKKTGVPTQVVVWDWGEAWNRISGSLEKNKDLPAVLQMGTTWIPHFASQNLLLNLEPWIAEIQPERFVPVSFNTTRIEGNSNIYSVPWFVDVRALLANRRILRENNITAKDVETYDGFVAALKKINDAGMTLSDGTPIYGYAFPGKSDWNIPHNFAPWIWSAGGHFVRMENGKRFSAILEKETLEGIAHYLNFILNGSVKRESLRQNTVQITQRYNHGELAFVLNTAEIVMQTRFAGIEGGLQTSEIGNDGVMVLPVPKSKNGSISFVGGSNLAVPANYPDKENAVKLLLYLTSDSLLDAYTKQIGFLPPVQSILNSWTADSVYKTLVSCLQHGKSYPSIPEWGDIENILVTMFSDIWSIMEFEELYSEEKIFEILKSNDTKINQVLKYDASSDSSRAASKNKVKNFTEFQKVWKHVLQEGSSSSENSSSVETSTHSATSNRNLTIGLFVIVALAGFAFAYRRKR